MKWRLVYLLLFILGLLEYLPIKNLPANLVEAIQSISFYLPIFSIIGLLYSNFKIQKSKLVVLFVPLLLLVLIFPMILRDQMNAYIISKNHGKPIDKIENVIAGTKMIKQLGQVSFEWNLADYQWETLIYQPNHNQKAFSKRTEIIEIINQDWYIYRSPLID